MRHPRKALSTGPGISVCSVGMVVVTVAILIVITTIVVIDNHEQTARCQCPDEATGLGTIWLGYLATQEIK